MNVHQETSTPFHQGCSDIELPGGGGREAFKTTVVLQRLDGVCFLRFYEVTMMKLR